MLFKSKKPSTKKDKLNHHFILIEAPGGLVVPEVFLWGEASWWPKNSLMKFTRLTPGEIQVGTKYQQKILLPLAPQWEAAVTRLVPGKEIERTFLNGMFKGKETVTIEERYNGTKVDYLMQYHVLGIWNKIVWPLMFERLHDQNIEMIFKSLRDYVMNKKEMKNA